MESNTALDLTHLNENEREVILAVLRRDEEFEKREKERVRRLKGTVEIQRRAGHVSPTTERGLIAKTGEWFTKKYRSVIGATPLVKISLHSAKLSSSRRGSETSDNSSKPDIIPLNGQEAVSEVEMERVLAPVLVQSFPILINEQPTKQSPQPTKQSPQSSPEVNRRQKLREQTKSKSPLVSSGSDSEVFNPGSMPSPEDRNQVTRQSTIDRLASDRRYLKVLPTGSLDSAVPTAAPMLVHLERIAQKSPPSSPRVPPQRNNTPHSPFGSREGTPQRVSALTSFDKGLLTIL
ncbi:uncharacterized protein LOC134187241 [Corticium candelabrum]|uniref:uncharacterized protein LOC134187241 n=1 Tax=Corticium candelabrum TaxID=121492 RepID=UPI002E2560B9|nr:uncharacterized protein LOC134187241 [Corticium candelabrum]